MDNSEFKLDITPLSSANRHSDRKDEINIKNIYLNNFDNYKSRNRNMFRKIQLKQNKSHKNIINNIMNKNSKMEFIISSRKDTKIITKRRK